MKTIRNFVIIAHIDAGKSTLADRFLELTATVQKHKMQEQYLDQMELERERGITIKMTPVTMRYKDYTLNLIDTPGHVDFSYEVSRSLAAVEGAILLVDAAKGIQAQTVAHLQLAVRGGLKIIPAINKIDLTAAKIAETEEEILALLMSLDISVEKVHKISAKTGEGVVQLLEAVIEKVPPPETEITNSPQHQGKARYAAQQLSPAPGQSSVRDSAVSSNALRALIFDSVYNDFKGIISYVRVIEGEIKEGDEILFMAQNQISRVKEVGIFSPQLLSTKVLRAGDIGYIVSGVKSTESSAIGDTITLKNSPASEAIPGYKEPQPVVFAGVHVSADADYTEMKSAL
jgi:GTP-binding protein LepA